MCKKLLSLALCLCLVLSLALPALAQEDVGWRVLRIRSRDQLLTLAESCRLDSYSQNLKVYLDTDLDLSQADWVPIPIFQGIFQGNGHKISGLTLTGDGSCQGLFRYLAEGAQVLNLKLSGQITPGGSAGTVGAIAGQNSGRIQNCTFTGTVSGVSAVGGLVGENTLTGIIEDCRVQGSVQGSHFVGGVAGKNTGVIRSCVSHAQVNTTSQENTVALEEIDVESILSSESAATVTDIGGIAGVSTGLIRSCVNHGDVGYQYMGYNVGGIAGTQSGFLTDCLNHGHIRGRKEVGGIVGQLEPAALVNFEEDALQILRRQLGSMGATVNKTAANVQDTGDRLFGQISSLGDHVVDAADAVEMLIPKQEGEEWILPDEDTLDAARGSLSSSISGMTGVLSGMSATTMSAIGSLSNNLHALQSQMNAMTATLDNVSETLGGSIQDMSDLDTQEDITGKVLRCRNFGSVLGDMNIGGIAGAMALENDLDPEEDVAILGENSLNFESQLRAVILDCENLAAVTAGKRAAGGIAGWQSLGLVKESVNTGSLEAQGAQYVGGISGQSLGFIRDSSAKCVVAGSDYVGGIAGSGAVVSGCYAMPLIQDAAERRGAILGFPEEDHSETETPTGNNFYLRLRQDEGGIDGISYEGIAQPLGLEAFFASPQVPASFREAKVTFRFQDGALAVFPVSAGEGLDSSQIPALPEWSEGQNRWEGLEEADLNRIFFDQTFREVRYRLRTTLESDARTVSGQPLLLAQGSFPDSAALEAKESALIPQLGEKEALLGAWVISLTHPDQTELLHLRLPRDCDGSRVKLLLHTAAGWQEENFTLDGSYLLFPMAEGLDGAALVEVPPYPWQYPALIAAGAALAALAVFLLGKRKKT